MIGVRCHGVAAWPLTWSERLAGWAEGVAFQLTWGHDPGAFEADAGWPDALPSRPVLGHPAVIAPDWAGELLAFSVQAVVEARQAWSASGLSRVADECWFTTWLNGAVPDGAFGAKAPHGVPGARTILAPDRVILFTPRILGPLGWWERKQGAWTWSFSPSVDGRILDGRTLVVRGGALADGYWRHGRIEPLRAEHGWHELSVRFHDIEEE